MDRAAVVEGVALILIGVVALGLYLGFSLTNLTQYYPLAGSSLPENPTYEALFYNVTATLYNINQSGWVFLMVRFNETEPPSLVMGVYEIRAGGAYSVVSSLQGLAISPTIFNESSQPFVMPSYELQSLPHGVLYFKGVPYPVAIENVSNISGGDNLTGRLLAYYDLSNGDLLLANLSYRYANGTPYSDAVYTLYNVTVLSYHRGVLSIVNVPVVYFAYGVLAAVAGAGLAVGLARLLTAA